MHLILSRGGKGTQASLKGEARGYDEKNTHRKSNGYLVDYQAAQAHATFTPVVRW